MPSLIRTARLTGVAYLGLAVTGMLGFLLIRPRLFSADDGAATLANIVANEALARTGIVLELAIVLTQALVAVLFYALFRSVHRVAAGAVAAFGLVNAVMILASTALVATAVEVALDTSLAPGGDAAATTQLLYVVSGQLWGVSGLFFGLWLVPMGWLVLRSRWMPRPLGWLLVGGGVGYVLGTLVVYLAPEAGVLKDVLTVPAAIGEFWMIGYLVTKGVSRRAVTTGPTRHPSGAPPQDNADRQERHDV